MDSHQPSSGPSYAPPSAAPGMFGTKIPSAVSFTVVVLLFLMPFLEIRCNGMKIKSVSGVQLATGFNTSTAETGRFTDDAITKTATNTDLQHPNYYALAALILGVLGLGLSFINNRTATAAAIATAVLGLAAMVGLLLDILKQKRNGLFGDLAEKTKDVTTGNTPDADTGFNNIGKGLSGMGITVDIAPFFYVVMVAFAAAAFFCYKRMTSSLK
jgi:hypothetical protein